MTWWCGEVWGDMAVWGGAGEWRCLGEVWDDGEILWFLQHFFIFTFTSQRNFFLDLCVIVVDDGE